MTRVDFASVNRSLQTASEWISLALGMSRLGGISTDQQKKAAAALREAADKLDPPTAEPPR